MFYQALEASGGFSSFISYNWHGFSTDLQKNVAAHCLATCFSHLPRLNFNRKYKIRGSTEKSKTVRGSYTDLDLSIHAKKGPKILMRHSL
jgi:hypothetical protein